MTCNLYKDVSLFNDIENVGHKAWNRLNVITNLKEDGRGHDAAAYLDKLSEPDKMSIGLLIMAIKKKGIETVKCELNKGEAAI
jgi:sensor histidine kinase regulating citrate/malate metabolism